MDNKERRSRKRVYAIKSVLNPYRRNRRKNFDSLFLTLEFERKTLDCW